MVQDLILISLIRPWVCIIMKIIKHCIFRIKNHIRSSRIIGHSSAHRIVAGVPGSSGATSTQLNNPKGIILDKDQNLYVADSENNRIQRFCLYSTKGITIAGDGTPGTQLNSPNDIAFDAAFNLYVVDTSNSRIERFERIV